ncbi:hypothetical protein NSPZN2_100182 [Nitrospira defluvii]|uniref:Uncharacterized protein n=1 Tax=Nitrospira defluvii TaxID=330214 RepID=A0ABM8R184_9BACT|nr:hypothetical protein NSPZN2_100182 [Nitrospira defluvii]
MPATLHEMRLRPELVISLVDGDANERFP